MDVIDRSTAMIFQNSNRQVDFMVQLVASGNWSLAGFYGDEGLRNKPDLAQALHTLFFSMGAHRVYAPTPVEFNAKLINPETFTTCMRLVGLGGSVLMLRNKSAPADGTMLRYIGDAGAFSAAGCPMIVAAYKKELLFAHAGRDCLLDRVRIATRDEKFGRPYGSVVRSIVETLRNESFEADRFDLSRVRVWVYGSIRPEDFRDSLSDPKYAEYNNKAYYYVLHRFGPECVEIKDHAVQLNLPVLIQKQFESQGVPGQNINITQAYLPKSYPTTRSGSTDRYAICVVRTS